ncbi:putative inner dynein arm light chain, axonemal [Bradysia coprophila]|uniref:putative inner dynein arm light chain, axonemal n=1 Tax=Bradysia coprophila TaxID=38358 RepID=UPI00187DC029|nr:putative inner dynein arm light chain, axonemal [Bradysia coprophila]
MSEQMDCEENAIDETTLVKYSNPVLVVKNPEKPSSSNAGKATSGKSVDGSDARKETEEILNEILPPRSWEEDGQLWIQMVSSVPATRQDVTNLQELLDARLQETQARETGICPMRRELFSQCFDEIIRQVTIVCAERGFILSRIRDEIAMTIEAYETLYCSSAAFGIRKALQSQEGKEQLYAKVKELESQCAALKQEITDMKYSFGQTERRYEEEKTSEERKHTEEVAFLKKTNAQLKSQLEGIIAPKK